MKRFFRLLAATGLWAPILVLLFHEFVSIRGHRTLIDWINHYSGGLAFTWFTWKSLPFLFPVIGPLTRSGRLGTAFLAGCTAALLWEIGEFGSDLVLGTHIQKSIENTMMDIVNGFLGTLTTVLILAFMASRTKREIAPASR